MSNAADPTAAFFAHIRASGLLRPEQLQELWAWIAASKPDIQGLAKDLNRRGWLTAFQIKEIFKGHGRELHLDRYILIDLLGEGGMGRVYKAHDTRMGRDLAIKVIRKDKLKHPAAVGRFEQEIQALSKMSHPNVVTVFDAGHTGETHFYVMELIDGIDLTKIVQKRGPLGFPEACEYIRQAALGLQHAFEAGLVHRDIKPSNIIVSRNGRQVKLVDLGLARLLENEAAAEAAGRITQEGFVIGTPDFLAPEQARNPMAVDIRADIYSLGGTLYYILTGKVPFDGANATEKMLKHCTEPPPGLLSHRPDAPPALEQIIHWCMAKTADVRPQTPLQLALALQPFCPLLPPTFAGPSSGPYPVPRPGTAVHLPLPPASGGHPAVPPGYAPVPGYPYPPPMPGFPAPPPSDPNPSSQVFKLPPQTTTDDPIRRRGERGFPWGMVLLGLGAIFVAGLLGFAVWRSFLSGPAEGEIESFTNSKGIRMVKIDGGKFKMGSPGDEVGRKADEGPQHEVTIRGPFLISATEITHSQYLQVMGTSPARSPDKARDARNLPVDSVTWHDANDFCARLTKQEEKKPGARKGWAYRLPTEAEWEYAARAGTDTPFSVGNGSRIVFGTEAIFRPTENDPLGFDGNPHNPPVVPQEIGKTEANAFGLSEVHGNVAEWCQDWYKPSYPGAAQVDPSGPADGDRRVIRGGSYKTPAVEVRSAARAGMRPNERRDDVGFRIVYAPVSK
jgi:serine/threonine protein kinase/formylglycine-generating enzyme required for sulfatase activity